MVIVNHLSNSHLPIKSTNKIPPYATDFKKEYLYIRGINNELKYFYKHLDEINDGLFESKRSDRLCYLIKRFLRGQEKGKLKDISDFMLPKHDYCYIQDFYININYEIDDYSFIDLLGKLYNKIKIEYIFSDYYGERCFFFIIWLTLFSPKTYWNTITC